LNRNRKVAFGFVSCATLSVRFRNFRTLCNEPFAIAFDDRSEFIVHCNLLYRSRPQATTARALSQRGRFFMAAFKLKHHSLDVLVILVPTQELQAFLRIAPLQDLDSLLTRAPRIHFTLIRHV
jgi:hypothetical protein